MPYKVVKIDPLDLQPRKAIGVSLPFSGQAVFNQTYQSKDAIKTNLINFFLTGIGERFLNPTFGTGLRNLLFEQLTEEVIRRVDSQIRIDLSYYFPRVKVIKLTLEANPDDNAVLFTLQYEIADTNISDELSINFEK